MAFYHHIHCKYTGVKGFLTLYNDALRYSYMITKKALHRMKVLVFWEKYGLDATMEAFNVKRRTLFNWKRSFNEGGKKPEALNEKKRAPLNKRKRSWNLLIKKKIEELRIEHPNLGKDKIHPELKEYCKEQELPVPSITTIGRLIKDLGGLRTFPKRIGHNGKVKEVKRTKRIIKPKDFRAEYPGHLVALDTIVSHSWGKKRYVITFEDIFTRISLAMGTSSHASKAAKEFFQLCVKAFPFPIKFVLTDNGSEFKKEFNQELMRLHMIHYHTYPRTPKMNAHCERFNRTLKEEFFDYHTFELAEDVDSFNRKLVDYLVWYNTRRVHSAFQNKLCPVNYCLEQLQTNKYLEECKMGWTYTFY